MKVRFLLLLALSTSTFAQLPEAPQPQHAAFAHAPGAPQPQHAKRLTFANLAMYGATVFDGIGLHREVRTCDLSADAVENSKHITTQGKFYAVALPIDGAVTALSIVAHKKRWHRLEIIAPLAMGSAHVSVGYFKYTEGCY